MATGESMDDESSRVAFIDRCYQSAWRKSVAYQLQCSKVECWCFVFLVLCRGDFIRVYRCSSVVNPCLSSPDCLLALGHDHEALCGTVFDLIAGRVRGVGRRV